VQVQRAPAAINFEYMTTPPTSLLESLKHLNAQQLRRLLVEHLTQQKVGLYWESSAIARDAALNADVVLPRLRPDISHKPPGTAHHSNLIIEGDNFDSLRLLRATHAGKVRVIYIDPPYNTGNKDWVYNDKFVGANDRYRHSQWLEFLYQRLTLARELLTSDGVILVSINDENRARLELLMDEVFPGRRLGTITWRTRQGSNADQQCFLSVDHEHVLVYGNAGFSFNGFEKSYEMYGNPDNDPRGDWYCRDNLRLSVQRTSESLLSDSRSEHGNVLPMPILTEFGCTRVSIACKKVNNLGKPRLWRSSSELARFVFPAKPQRLKFGRRWMLCLKQ
jgi:hypothetical protein